MGRRPAGDAVEGHRAAPTGKLRVTLPLDPALSAMVAPIAEALLRQHPSLNVRFLPWMVFLDRLWQGAFV